MQANNGQPYWFDSHAHLQDADFEQDRAEVLERAKRNHVLKILIPSTSFDDSLQAIELAKQSENLCCSVGCHPHEAKTFENQTLNAWFDLVRLHRFAPIVAIGEIGLDYHYDFCPRDIQCRVFRAQLELAHALNLPVVIHEREATADCLKILEQADKNKIIRCELPGVFHCFSGSVETSRMVREMGFYIGVDGPLTFKNARKPLAVVADCPQDALLIETDSPYLAPVPFRGKRNEPAYLPLIGEKVAQIWGLSPEDVSALTTENACRLFGLPSA